MEYSYKSPGQFEQSNFLNGFLAYDSTFYCKCEIKFLFL